MGGVDPPFLYDKPSSYTFAGPTTRAFDPKSVTRQSWTPKQQKPKADGPLINFNRHPDSYVVVPYGNLNAQAMNPNTKGRVNFVWKSQRWLRVLQLLGGLGALFCIISIRKTSSTVGWIIRVGPAVAVCHLLYAVYFLSRRPASRPPASCASYQMFAGLLDTGLVPFFVFSAYIAYEDYSKNAYGWGTLFNDNTLDHDIIQAFWLISTCMAGLILISITFDFYLAVTYRKICVLPPDMNPLEEDNLTARPRHKRNKSELLYEKHMSTSTLASQRMSQISQQNASSRRVPFIHTRTDSADGVTLYGNNAAKQSRASLRSGIAAERGDPYGTHSPMAFEKQSMPSRPGSAIMPSPNSRAVGAGLHDDSPRSSPVAARTDADRPSSWLSYVDYEGVPANMSDMAQHELDGQIRPMSPVSAMSGHERMPIRASFENVYPNEIMHEQHSFHDALYTSHQNTTDQKENLLPPAELTPPRKRSREPLGMNPPTPVNLSTPFIDSTLAPRPLSISSTSTPARKVLQESTNTNSQARPKFGARPSSFIGSGGKSRFYGNLRTSVGAGGGNGPVRDFSFDAEADLHRSNTVRTEESANFEVYGSDDEIEDEEEYLQDHQHGPAVMVGQSSPGHQWNGQRQISNSTGYDLHGTYAGLDAEFGKGMATRRREVSGKVAEEGRSFEQVQASEVVPVQPRNGAAGWARFKGL